MEPDILKPVSQYFSTDSSFDELYPSSIKLLSRRHWTPLHIVKLAMEFLGCAGTNVLDIGSGVGKFCLAAAFYAPEVKITGVEQRNFLLEIARRTQQHLHLQNVSFIKSNFTQVDLRAFDHFYFFNSFYENLDDNDRIDDSIYYSEALYEYYVRYLHTELKKKPAGTRVVTYHSLMEEIPREYKLIETLDNGNLNFWQKR